MYFYLRGTIVLHQKGSIVIECNGVGYEVFVSHPEDYEIGEYMLVYTSFYVREDEQFLVGFKSFEEVPKRDGTYLSVHRSRSIYCQIHLRQGCCHPFRKDR